MADEQAQAASTETAVVDTTGVDRSSQPDLSGASLAQLDTLLTTGTLELQPDPSGEGKVEAKVDPAPVVPAVGEQPAVADPVVEVDAPVVVEKTAEQIAAEADEAAEVELLQRPRLKDPVDQEIAAVKRAADKSGAPISWAEAELRVKGAPPAKVEPEPVVAAVDHVAEVATIQTEVDVIKARLTELGDAEGLLTPEYSKLSIELAEKSADLKLAKRDAKQAEAQAAKDAAEAKTASEAARAESRKLAIGEFPDVADKTTVLGAAVAKRFAEMRNPKHADHALLYTDSAALRVARDVADELGIKPVAKVAAVAPPVIPPVVAPRPVVMSPASGVKTSVQPVNPVVDAKNTLEYLRSDKATLAELDAAQGGGSMSDLLAAAAA